MTCAERDLLPRRADGELTHGERRRLDAHLARCPACRETAALLDREAVLLRAALSGRPASRRPSRVRSLVAAAVLVPLLFVGLFALLSVYEGARPRLAGAARLRAALERPVAVRAAGTPLTGLVRELEAAAGVPVRLSPGALDRIGGDPLVRLELVEPIRLRFVLALIQRFHGLRMRVGTDAIRLE